MANRDKRLHVRSAFIGGLVAALTVMALPAVAAEVAAALQLGQTNTANARTTLTGAVGSTNLRIVNTDPDGSPLSLISRRGEPPMKVNRVAKVKNLNADRVDGLHAPQLIRVAHAAADNVDEAVFFGGAADVLTVTVKAPRAGFLVMGSTIDAENPESTRDIYRCQLDVDGTKVTGTHMFSTTDASLGGTFNNSEDCTTTGVKPVCPGTHTVDLNITGKNSVVFYEATLWAMYVPFDGEGRSPLVVCSLPQP